MNNSFIISGTLFGDEGKGSFVDYLASENNINQNARYNGGSQASHTVTINNVVHKFSQLGSSMFIPNNKTYLSSNTVVNPFNLYTEAKVFSEASSLNINEILNRIYIDSGAIVVTPYHKLIDQIIELSEQNNRRGSVGTGVSLSRKLFDYENLGIKVKDLQNIDKEVIEKIKELRMYVKNLLDSKRHLIDDKLFSLINPQDILYLTDDSYEDYVTNCYINIMEKGVFNIVDSISEFYTPNEDIIMEGSQALLIDKTYGIKPNTTFIDTTNKYGIELSKEINYNPVKIGASKAFASRHGFGILPTKDDELCKMINDKNQTTTYWQGKPTYGWFDSLLMRYSQKISNNDELFISSMDLLSGLKTIKICDSYLYTGTIDEEFDKTFEYVIESNKIIIIGIKENNDKLRYYLGKCVPIYTELKGWERDISKITCIDDLPNECIEFIEYIEKLIGVPVTLMGVGPSRENKIRRLVK